MLPCARVQTRTVTNRARENVRYVIITDRARVVGADISFSGSALIDVALLRGSGLVAGVALRNDLGTVSAGVVGGSVFFRGLSQADLTLRVGDGEPPGV